MQEPLRSVPPSDGNAAPQKSRAAQRPRPSKALPSDRMKFDSAVLALKAIVLDSGNGARAVSSQDIANRLSISSATAGLNNAFFTEAGFVTRETKGKWKPTKAAVEFARRHSFDSLGAGRSLADALRASWYFREVEQQAAMGPTDVDKMVEVLARAAGATVDHRPQLRLVLQWLQYARLIDLSSGRVKVNDPSSDPAEMPQEDPVPPADPPSAESTTLAQQSTAGTVLTFNFDFSLSAADLAALSSDQIRAVFEAVGHVAAIKAGRDQS